MKRADRLRKFLKAVPRKPTLRPKLKKPKIPKINVSKVKRIHNILEAEDSFFT
jgi:hypothetical protein